MQIIVNRLDFALKFGPLKILKKNMVEEEDKAKDE
jgi:hypothetical protein